jgi:hypothetical protein
MKFAGCSAFLATQLKNMALHACGDFNNPSCLFWSGLLDKVEFSFIPSIGCFAGNPVLRFDLLQYYHWRSQDENFGQYN